MNDDRLRAHADIDLLAENVKAMAGRLERIDAEIERAGLAALVADREIQHEFECLAIEHRSASVMADRYREDLSEDQPAEFLGFRGSSTCAAVMIAAECRLRAFRELVAIMGPFR